MNKKLITLAVAAALAAPAAAMAEATLYGKLNVSIDYANVKNAVAPVYETGTGYAYDANGNMVVNADGDPIMVRNAYVLDSNGNVITQQGGQDFNGWGVNGQGSYMPGESRANRVGVKGSEDLGNGLKAIYQVEFGVYFGARDDNIPSGNNGGVDMRNSFVGLAGDWGTFLVGRHDTPLKISTGKLDLFVDTMADYNGTVGFDDLRVDNTAAYISPSFGGLSFAGAVVAPGGATAGYGANINSDSLAGAYSLALIYSNGPFYASAAYESLSNEMFNNANTSLGGSGACLYQENGYDAYGIPVAGGTGMPNCNYVNDDYNKWRFGLGLLDWNGFTLTAIYENQDNLPLGQQRQAVNFIDQDGNIVALGTAPLGADSQQLWQVEAGYAFGNSMFKAMYGSVDRGDVRAFGATRETLSLNNLSKDLAGDRSTWAVGFDHNFSKRTQAYILYTNVDDDGNGTRNVGYDEGWDGFSLGMKHSF